MGWKVFFNVVNYTPGPLFMARLGKFDLRDENISVEKIKALYDAGCPFLSPTAEGLKKFYPDIKPIETKPFKKKKSKL
jgi:hypothetical protein